MFQDATNFKAKMNLRISSEAFGGEREKASCWGEATLVGRMFWKLGMFLKVHKAACKLNQSLVKAPVSIRTLEPEMLQDVMSLVEVARVKA